MSLENTINDAIKTAMKEKDKVALDSLRAVKSQILLLKTAGSRSTKKKLKKPSPRSSTSSLRLPENQSPKKR